MGSPSSQQRRAAFSKGLTGRSLARRQSHCTAVLQAIRRRHKLAFRSLVSTGGKLLARSNTAFLQRSLHRSGVPSLGVHDDKAWSGPAQLTGQAHHCGNFAFLAALSKQRVVPTCQQPRPPTSIARLRASTTQDFGQTGPLQSPSPEAGNANVRGLAACEDRKFGPAHSRTKEQAADTAMDANPERKQVVPRRRIAVLFMRPA